VFEHVLPKFGANVRRLREQRGYSQEGFADHAGLDRSFYGRVERGKQNIAILTIMRIATALEVPPEELFRDINADGFNKLD
jgi:transcriptional regulator with XRE-family HTH domain